MDYCNTDHVKWEYMFDIISVNRAINVASGGICVCFPWSAVYADAERRSAIKGKYVKRRLFYDHSHCILNKQQKNTESALSASWGFYE